MGCEEKILNLDAEEDLELSSTPLLSLDRCRFEAVPACCCCGGGEFKSRDCGMRLLNSSRRVVEATLGVAVVACEV